MCIKINFVNKNKNIAVLHGYQTSIVYQSMPIPFSEYQPISLGEYSKNKK